VEKLDGFPLATAQAAVYMYRKQNQRGKVPIQDEWRARDYPNLDYLKSTSRAWRLSFKQIWLHGVRAAELLSLMVMLGRKVDTIRTSHRLDERDVDSRSALGTLDGYLLDNPVGDDMWTMHASVQLSVHD
jgi:hypothetical protein